MQKLYSIQTADRLFDTGGSRPVLLTCNDMKGYVCKYNTGSGSAIRLMCEYIGASFLKLWKLNIPDFALVKVNREHIPAQYGINAYYFDTTCFGLQYSRTFAEVIDFTANISHQQRNTYWPRNNFYSKVKQCQENTVELIGQLPPDWNINKKELETKLMNEIFVDKFF